MQTARRLVKGPDTAETSKKHFANTGGVSQLPLGESSELGYPL